MTKTEALETLNAWFASHGSDTSGSNLDVWDVWDFQDAWVFTPGGGRRTNQLYMVRDLAVVAFAPSDESVEKAYNRLDTKPSPPGPNEPKNVRIDGALSSKTPDGVHYYLEEGNPPYPLGPMVYRVTIVDGVAHDTHWDPQERTWTPSRRLGPYRTNQGPDTIYSTTPLKAGMWRLNRQKLWEEANPERSSQPANPAAQRVNDLLKELQTFPTWSGISFRGMSAEAEFGRTANVAVARGLVATSRDARVATENFSTPGVYAVLGTEGRGIESVSRYPDEHEILFLPGAAFAVVDTIDVEGYPVVLVRQAKLSANTPPVDTTDFENRARNAVSSGRNGPQVPITSPRKYVGDID